MSAGVNNKVENNIVIARQQSFTNVGMYIAVFPVPGKPLFACHDNTFSNNTVHFVNKDGFVNNFWMGDNCQNTVVESLTDPGALYVPPPRTAIVPVAGPIFDIPNGTKLNHHVYLHDINNALSNILQRCRKRIVSLRRLSQ